MRSAPAGRAAPPGWGVSPSLRRFLLLALCSAPLLAFNFVAGGWAHSRCVS